MLCIYLILLLSMTAGTFQTIIGPIKFYNSNEPFYEFTNFYERPIIIDNKNWNSSEHYFQAQKFVGTPYMDIICKMQRPRDAFDLSRRPEVSKWLRSDWEKIKLDVMFKALLAKFSQHKDFKALLLSTGNRMLVEHTSNDSYWGDGGDGHGENNLGKLLMRVREVLMTSSVVSVVSDGDETEDGGGPGYIRESSGNGYSSSSDMNEGNGPSYKGENSRLAPHVPELAWGDKEEEQLSHYPPEDPTDNSDQGEAAGKNDASSMPSPPRLESCSPIATDQKIALSGIPTSHKTENTAECMEL